MNPHFFRILNHFTHRYSGTAFYREELVLLAAYISVKLSAWPCCVTGSGRFHDSSLELLDGIALLTEDEAKVALQLVELILEDIGSAMYAPSIREEVLEISDPIERMGALNSYGGGPPMYGEDED